MTQPNGSWAMTIDRDDLSRTSLRTLPTPEPAAGQVLLRIDRVGVTANNVTYAALGDTFRYWEFFPTEAGRGIVPLWGFAEVVESQVDGVRTGSRYYGYYPAGSHLLVRPDRVGESGFRDASPHRAELPSPYNNYALTTSDPAYDDGQEDLTTLYRPLFWTSYMLADWLADTGLSGAERVVMSSASSKTAYGTAFLLRGSGTPVVGLTSPRNVAFTEALGCYDSVLTYDEVGRLASGTRTLYADFAGDAALTNALKDRLGADLVRNVVVGVTHQEIEPAGTLGGTETDMFFAPVQMAKRIADWGRPALDTRFAEAWRSFAAAAVDWVDVVEHHGPEGMREVWAEVQSGRAAPRDGHIWAP